MVLNTFTLCLVILGGYLGLVGAQLDPVVNFCRRLDHQSILLNDVIYIDGGREIFSSWSSNGTEISNRTVGNNQQLISINMTTTWDWKAEMPIAEIPKLYDSTGLIPVPAIGRASLFPDPNSPTKFWLFGGTVAKDNTSFIGFTEPGLGAESLWSYESSTNIWTSYNMSQYGIEKPSSGAHVAVKDLGLAFWYNGMQDNGTSAEISGVLGDTSRFLDGMVVLDLYNQSARNLSTTAVSSRARVRGEMIHLPLPGSDGIIVLIGGGQKPSSDLTHDWKGTLISMQSVDIFDISSLKNASTPDGTWYSQRTSGSTPSPRLDFCLVLASAPDNSSHNIYMYGGRDGLNAYFDEVWVLTIPTFQWVLVWQGSSPRHSHTCHLAGNRQMITVGGSNGQRPTTTCDWEYRGVGILDLSTATWGSTYDAKAPVYTVPNDVVKVIGGTLNGGATFTEPITGYTNPSLQHLLQPPSSINTTTNTTTSTPPPPSTPSPSPSSTLSTASIAGITISLVSLTLIILTILFFLRRRRHQRAALALLQSEEEARITREREEREERERGAVEVEYDPITGREEMLGSVAVYEKLDNRAEVCELRVETEPVEMDAGWVVSPQSPDGEGLDGRGGGRDGGVEGQGEGMRDEMRERRGEREREELGGREVGRWTRGRARERER